MAATLAAAWADPEPTGRVNRTALVTRDTKIEAHSANGGYAAVPLAAGTRVTLVSVAPDGTATVINSFGFKGTVSRNVLVFSEVPAAPVATAPATDIHPPDSAPVVITVHKKTDEALRQACEAGDLDRIAALADEGDNLEMLNKDGETLLIAAAEEGKTDVVKLLLAKGAKLEAMDPFHCDALMHAASQNRTDTCLALLDAGADANCVSRAGQGGLQGPAQFCNLALIQAFLDHHANVNMDSNIGTPLISAINARNVSAADRQQAVLVLLAAGADPNIVGKKAGIPYVNSDTALGDAVFMGDHDLAQILLDHGAAVDGPSTDGDTPLMWAATHSDTEAINLLLAHQANLACENKKGETALMNAIYSDRTDTVDYLIKAGADLKSGSKLNGLTPLMYACGMISASMNMVQHLVAQGAGINATDHAGETALTYAGNRGHADLAAYLQQQGALRTDLHIFATASPQPSLSPARQWALATIALYAQKFADNPHYLGGYTPEQFSDGKKDTRDDLKKSWNIQSKEDLIHRMTELKRAADQKPGDHFMLAWDLVRYIHVISMGRAANYLSEGEAWDMIQPAALEIQRNFSSWPDLADNFLKGRTAWTGSDVAFEGCYHLLANTKDPNSAWNQNAWNCDLSHLGDKKTALAP